MPFADVLNHWQNPPLLGTTPRWVCKFSSCPTLLLSSSFLHVADSVWHSQRRHVRSPLCRSAEPTSPASSNRLYQVIAPFACIQGVVNGSPLFNSFGAKARRMTSSVKWR
jgi:hypothetical protein